VTNTVAGNAKKNHVNNEGDESGQESKSGDNCHEDGANARVGGTAEPEKHSEEGKSASDWIKHKGAGEVSNSGSIEATDVET